MFSKQQNIWIVENFSPNSSPLKLRREFCKQHNITGRNAAELKVERFLEVIRQFRKEGFPEKKTPPEAATKPRIETLKVQIAEQIGQNPGVSIRKLSSMINAPKTSVHRLMKCHSNWSPTSIPQIPKTDAGPQEAEAGLLWMNCGQRYWPDKDHL